MCSEVTKNHFLAAYLTGDLDVLDSCLQAPVVKNQHDIHQKPTDWLIRRVLGSTENAPLLQLHRQGKLGKRVFLTVVGCHSIKVTSHTETINLRDFFRSPHVREERGEISLDDWLRTFHATSMKKKLKDADIETPAKFPRSLVL